MSQTVKRSRINPKAFNDALLAAMNEKRPDATGYTVEELCVKTGFTEKRVRSEIAKNGWSKVAPKMKLSIAGTLFPRYAYAPSSGLFPKG